MRKIYDVKKSSSKKPKQRDAAKAVARRGRHGDSQIVHMSPGEVAGLTGIARASGTKLTRNPDTGALEAFNLKKMLKTIAPIAAGIVGGPLAGALVSAAITKEDGGSWKEAALSGIGSYAAGAALGGTQSGVNAAAKNGVLQGASSNVAGKTVEEGMKGAATKSVAQGAASSTADEGIKAAVKNASTAPVTTVAGDGIASAVQAPASASVTNTAIQNANAPAPTWTSLNMGDKMAVASNQFSPSKAMFAKSAFDSAGMLKDQREAEFAGRVDDRRARKRGEELLSSGLDPYQYHYAAGGAVDTPPPSPYVTDPTAFRGQAFRPAFDFSQYKPTIAQDPVGGGRDTMSYLRAPTRTYAARGNAVYTGNTGPDAAQKSKMQEIAQQAARTGYVGPASTPYEQAFWARGVAYPGLHNNTTNLSTYFASGGMVQGQGDGMSDGIAALIDNEQPAAIASGEYIIPADVVSHLGNGDTNSGAAYLDSQMAAIRQASTGKPIQRKRINPTQFLR